MNRISDATAEALEKYLVSMFENRKETLDGRIIVKLLEYHREYNYYKQLEEDIENNPFETNGLYEQKKITKRWKITACICSGCAFVSSMINLLHFLI